MNDLKSSKCNTMFSVQFAIVGGGAALVAAGALAATNFAAAGAVVGGGAAVAAAGGGAMVAQSQCLGTSSYIHTYDYRRSYLMLEASVKVSSLEACQEFIRE